MLADVFQDHMVLQRGKPVAVWGEAMPGSAIEVRLGASSTKAMVSQDGRFRVDLPAQGLSAEGLVLSVRDASGALTSRSDVRLGDVFLCSGQSNMALSVSAAMDAYNTQQNAHDSLIRGLLIERTSQITPQARLPGDARWKLTSPANVGAFSAACWFMARELRRAYPAVPIGLIMASWGGSAIEPWLSPQTAAQSPDLKPRVAALEAFAQDPIAGAKAWGQTWQDWYATQEPNAAVWQDANAPGWQPVPANAPFEEWGVPELTNHNGQIWFRTKVNLTSQQAANAAVLQIGDVDEIDTSWVNGVSVGSTGQWGLRRYQLPAGTLKAGENLIVINAYDTWGRGGFYSPVAERVLELGDGSKLPLGAAWEYRLARASGPYPRAPWDALGGVSTLHNGMLAPLAGLQLAGAAWYQGESNVGRDVAYRAHLRALMADWRAMFGPDLPVFVVQLANFGAFAHAPGDSAWARLREAQRLGVNDSQRAALITIIDVGEPSDIHPPNKQAVGVRLARAARALVHGEAVNPSGPQPVNASWAGGRVLVATSGTTQTLRARGSDLALGFELCATLDGLNCRFVLARPQGTGIALEVPKGFVPKLVRYAWADSPVTNLADADGMPLVPFQLPVTQMAHKR